MAAHKAVDRRLARGYPRRDVAAQGLSGRKGTPSDALLEVAPSTIQRALTMGLDGGSPPEGAELDWFRYRWQMGDVKSMAIEARRVCEEAARWTQTGLLPDLPTVMVIPSPAVGAPGGATRTPCAVAVGPETCGAAAMVAVIAAALRKTVSGGDLRPADGDWLRRQIAASLLHDALEDDSERASLAAELAATLLPVRGEEQLIHQRIRRIAARLLDQPPGEVDRIAAGFSQHRASRLMRAWRRFFFAPTDFDLDAWRVRASD